MLQIWPHRSPFTFVAMPLAYHFGAHCKGFKFKIGLRHPVEDSSTMFHPYCLWSQSCRHGITSSIANPTTLHADIWHSSLLQNLSKDIWANLSNPEELGIPDPFPSNLYSPTPIPEESNTKLQPPSSNSVSTPFPSNLFPSPATLNYLINQLTSTHLNATMSQPVIHPMPAHGDCRAPQFNPSKPCELHQFFEELKFQFVQAHVANKGEMKLQFIDCNTVELWEILPEFTNVSTPYQDFVDAVYKLYPGSNMEQCWSITDIDKLVGETLRYFITHQSR